MSDAVKKTPGRKVGEGLTSKYSKELGFSFNINLGSNLEYFRDAVSLQDFDCVILVDGKEGGGKSVHGLQIAYFLDKDHHVDLDTQVCYTPEQLKKAITTLPKFKAIVFDEARRGFNRRRSTDKVNIELTDLFAECRQNNLFLIIIMPTFYDMDMNMAVWRSRLLVHVTYKWDKTASSNSRLVRGFARLYNEEGKKRLYVDDRCRKLYTYPFLRDKCFDYSFPHHYVVDEQEYRNKKRLSEQEYRKKSQSDMAGNCPGCGSSQVRYMKKAGLYSCRLCPFEGKLGGPTHAT